MAEDVSVAVAPNVVVVVRVAIKDVGAVAVAVAVAEDIVVVVPVSVVVIGVVVVAFVPFCLLSTNRFAATDQYSF